MLNAFGFWIVVLFLAGEVGKLIHKITSPFVRFFKWVKTCVNPW